MASEERNALEELAKFLKGESECGSTEFKAKVIEKYGEASWNRYVERKRKFYRASRIITELVKASSPYDLVGLVGKCRAIAEEGANNGD